VFVRPSIHSEPAQRYWRRRANRRVRKARMTRSILRWSALAAMHGCVIALLVTASWRIYRGLTTTSEFALEEIEVSGTMRMSPATILARLEPYRGSNLFELDLYAMAQEASRDPWAAEVSAKRVLPNAVRVMVRERKPCALALIGGIAHVVDEWGFVIGPSGPGLPDDLPVLVGLEKLSETELVAALERGTRAVGELQRQARPWIDGVSELDLSQPDRITARVLGDAAPILLDPDHVSQNLAEWLALGASISRRVGPLEYVDLRWRDRITVMPELPL